MDSVENTRDAEEACKFKLCVLRTQLGKTFAAIRCITTEIEQDGEFGKSIHLVFTMNTLLNNKQFSKRLTEIEEKYESGTVAVFASKYEGKYRHVKNINELQGICADIKTCPRIVVMCSNTHRYEDGVRFLDVINRNPSNISRAFVYYDELHEYISGTLRKQIEKIHSFDIVKGIMALSGTPDKIWEGTGFWSKLRLIELDDLNDANYSGYNDMVFTCIDEFFELPYTRPSAFDYDELDGQTIGFIEWVMKRHDLLKDNTRTFIPAHVRRSGHNKVRDIVFQKNKDSVVVVLNGVEKTLQYIDSGNIITLKLESLDEEVCETISRMINSNKLKDRPLVITGFLCVGMGQTLMHESLGPFTSAIFGHMDLTNDAIYQLFGRITGRTKGWSTYVPTQVYCPTTIMDRCHVMEECARNMVLEYDADLVDQDMYRAPMYNMGEAGKAAEDNLRTKKSPVHKASDMDKDVRIFENMDDAIQFGKTLRVNFHKRKDPVAPKELQKDGKNPTKDDLLKRMWGIDEKNHARMIPTEDNKWCVYWRPSLIRLA